WHRAPAICSNPQQYWGAMDDACDTHIEVHRDRQAAGPAGEVEHALCSAMPLHRPQAFQRLERTQQDARSYAWRFATDVDREPAAVDEINIGVSALQKQRVVASRAAAERMRRRIADNVRLGLDDAAGDAPARVIVDQYLADEIACQCGRVSRQLGSAQSANGSDFRRGVFYFRC